MPALLVAGIGTDVGKTYVSAQVLAALRARGLAVDAFKPLASGLDPDRPAGSDPAVLLAALGEPVTPAALARVSPWRFRAALAPDQAAALEGRRVDADAVVAACRARIEAASGGWLLIETAGGIMSPLDARTTMLDLAAALGLPVLLVAGAYLGAISHTLTAVRVLEAAGLAPVAVAVSESAATPPFESAFAPIRARLAPLPVFAVRRDARAPDALMRLLMASARPRH
jgi:dethiobiotin synthetase